MWAALSRPSAIQSAADDATPATDVPQLEKRMNKRFDKLEKTLEEVLRQLRHGGKLGTDTHEGVDDEHEHVNDVHDNDDQWTTVLQGDPQVASMMKDLRAAGAVRAAHAHAAGPRRVSAPTRGGAVRTATGAPLDERTTGWATGRNSQLWQRVVERMPVLHPEGRVRSAWNVLMALLICWCAVVVPLEIGYDTALRIALGDSFRAWEIVNYTFDFIFLIDIVLNFRTGFVVDGQFVTSGRLIAVHYLRGPFFVDLIGSFPINLIIDLAVSDGSEDGSSNAGRLNRPLRMLRIVKLNRLLRLSKLSKYLKYLEVILEFNPSFLRVLKLMIVMVGCCHWMGCCWWLVTELELAAQANETGGLGLVASHESQNTWQPSQELLESTLSEQFASGFFWGAGFITAMVPYDIMPATAVEYYVTAVCMFVGLLLNAFVIGSMASALQSLDHKKQICRGKLETIGLYLLVNNVSADLRGRILEYYEYLYTSTQSMEDLRIYQDLPPSLATRLAITVHRRIVTRAPLFHALSDATLLAVLANLRPRIYVPGQFFFVEGQILREVSFLKKGAVHLLHEVGTSSEVVVRTLGANDHVGLEDQHTRAIAQHLATPPSESGSMGSMGPSMGKLLARRGSRASLGHAAVAGGGEGEAWFKHYLTTLHVHQSARAATYCDVVSIGVEDLAELLVKDHKARMEKERRMTRRTRAAQKAGVNNGVGGMGMRIKFLARFNRAAARGRQSATAKREASAALVFDDEDDAAAAATNGSKLTPIAEAGGAEEEDKENAGRKVDEGGEQAAAAEEESGDGAFLAGVQKAAVQPTTPASQPAVPSGDGPVNRRVSFDGGPGPARASVTDEARSSLLFA